MSLIERVPLYNGIKGLYLKRVLGSKLKIKHNKTGEELTIQVVAFWTGLQVTLAFSDPNRNFEVERCEAKNGNRLE